MPNVTEEFLKDPVAFLKKYVVEVADTTDKTPKSRTVTFVTIKDTTMVTLRNAMGKEASVKAHWLPWKESLAASMDLTGDDINYFFTSQMTNCRFSVLTKDTKMPKVAHVAGNVTPGKRNIEEGKITSTLGEKAVERPRRLSVSGSELHGYKGQKTKKVDDKLVDDSSSAFVYGVRDKDSKEWTFAAQIVKGALKDGLKATDAVPEIINGNYAI